MLVSKQVLIQAFSAFMIDVYPGACMLNRFDVSVNRKALDYPMKNKIIDASRKRFFLPFDGSKGKKKIDYAFRFSAR